MKERPLPELDGGILWAMEAAKAGLTSVAVSQFEVEMGLWHSLLPFGIVPASKKTAAMYSALTLVKYFKVLNELVDGDYWKQRVADFIGIGGCPYCFAGEADSHKEWCEWGKDVRLVNKFEQQVNGLKAMFATVLALITVKELPTKEIVESIKNVCEQASNL